MSNITWVIAKHQRKGFPIDLDWCLWLSYWWRDTYCSRWGQTFLWFGFWRHGICNLKYYLDFHWNTSGKAWSCDFRSMEPQGQRSIRVSTNFDYWNGDVNRRNAIQETHPGVLSSNGGFGQRASRTGYWNSRNLMACILQLIWVCRVWTRLIFFEVYGIKFPTLTV